MRICGVDCKCKKRRNQSEAFGNHPGKVDSPKEKF